jgi:hypothetical protein
MFCDDRGITETKKFAGVNTILERDVWLCSISGAENATTW